ncbi:unnamed protein product [Auanema sp. JU1783]|nr:unnamed protein product [Auanema sp. JU1783]
MTLTYSKMGTASSDHTDESIISDNSSNNGKTKSKMSSYRTEEFADVAIVTAKYMKEKDRKVSTGTLNRLILVAQALESEVDSRRQTDISGGKITLSLRMANMILLILINILIFTGFGKYQEPRDSGYRDLLLTADKWTFESFPSDLPDTFNLMQLNGQYLAAAISVSLLISTTGLQIFHLCRSPSSRITSMCYSFGAVPFSLFVFGLEMHYSTCPWVDEYYLRFSVSDMSAQCAINGWALAGIFSLLSCGLFVSEGLITAFFRPETVSRKETIL